jgi:uncharacterized protein (TIGR03086 family)
MSSVDDIARAVAVFQEQAAATSPDDLSRPTPCEGWDVRTLVGHVVGLYDGFAGALHGDRVDLVAASADVGDAPARAIDRAAQTMLTAWREPGALDRTLATNIRDMPAALATRIVIGDSLLHAWDLAHALGRDVSMPTDLADAQLTMMQEYYDPAARGPGKGFALAVECPADASVEARLVALSGRDPAWAPPPQ